MAKIIPMQNRRNQRSASPRREKKPRSEGRPAGEQQRRVVEVENRVAYKQAFDYTIVILLVGLISFGLVMVYSSSYYVSEVNGESQAYYFLKQLLCVAIGTIVLIFLMKLDYHCFIDLQYDARKMERGQYRYRPLLSKPYIWVLGASILTLGLVYTPLGVSINESRRWINVGISIQPSEIVKIGLIIYIACSLGENPRRMRNFWNGLFFPYLLILLFICGIIFFSAELQCHCMHLYIGGIHAVDGRSKSKIYRSNCGSRFGGWFYLSDNGTLSNQPPQSTF